MSQTPVRGASEGSRRAPHVDRYRSLFDNMLEGLAYCRMEFDQSGSPLDYVYLEVNRAFEDLTGLQNVIGRKGTDVIPGLRESNPEIFEILGRVVTTGQPEKFETFVPQLHAWFSISVYSPQKGHFVAAFDNVTERKRAAEALQNNERRFRALIENGQDQVSLVAADGTLIWESPSAIRTLGYLPDQHVGQSIFSLVHPDDLDRMRDELAGLVQRPALLEGNAFRIRHADGSWRWIEGVASNLLHDPAVGAIVINYRDVTERKRAEDELAANAERYRHMFENNPHPMWVYDVQSLAFLAVNDAAIEKYGFARDEFLHMTLADIRPPDDLPLLMQTLSRQPEPFRHTTDVRHRLKDGAIIDVKVSSHVLELDGRPCVLTLAQDITETKKAEARIRFVTRLYATISQVNQAIVRIHDRAALLQKICDVAVEYGDFRLAWVGSLDRRTGRVTPEAHAGFDAGYLQTVDINVFDEAGSRGPTGTAIRTGQAVFIDDIASDPKFAPWSAPALERGYRSYAALPIRQDDTVVGTLALYAAEAGFFDREHMRLLEEIGEDISFALATIEAERNRRQLESERSFLLNALEQSLNEIYIFEPESLHFEYVNRGALRNLGRTAQEMLALTPIDIKPEFTEASYRQMIQPLLRGEQEKVVFETVHQRADGTLYPVEINLQLTRQGDRSVFLAIALDISERKRADAELKESERRYRGILSGMMEGCQIIDHDWRFIYVNHTAALQEDQRVEDLLMRTLMEVSPGIEDTELFQILDGCMQGRYAQRTESEIRFGDGPSRWFELSIQPVPEGLFILSIDITERKRAEAARQASEERFRKFFELGLVGMAITSPEKGFVEVNERICEILGYPREQLLKQDWLEMTYPEDRTVDVPQFNRLLAGEIEAYSLEKRFIHATGRLVFTIISVSAVRRADGKLDYCVALIQDITERKRAEAELRASEQKYRSLFNNVPDGVYRTNEQGRLLAANPALVQMLGYDSAAELQQVNVADLYADPVERPKDLSVIRSSRETRNLEVRLRRKDGTLVNALNNSRTVRDASGAVAYFEGTLTDITERKRAEQALQLENERFQRFIDSNIIGIVIGDVDGNILMANDYYLGLLGATRQDLQAGNLQWRAFTPPEWLPADEKSIQELEATGVCQPYEKEYQRPDGTRVPVLLGDAVLPGPEGQVLSFVLDISERKEAEKRVRQHLSRISGLRDVDRAITSSFNLKLTMDTILNQVREQLGAAAASVWVLDPQSKTLSCVAGHGLREAQLGRAMVRLGEGLVGTTALERHAVHYSDLNAIAAANPEVRALLDEGLTAYYGVPLTSKGQVKGILEVFHRSNHEGDWEWLDYLETLSDQAAIAIDSIQMLEGLNQSNLELSRAYDATIEGWSRALDLRDKETEGHTRRVTEITVHLARLLNVGETQLTNMRWGALLHDIGKLGVPDSILLKPGALLPEEWVLMKKHPELAYEMLAPIHYLHGALDIPLSHHEKWDGSGYPRGLKGEQIPLAARIFAIVDIWDALRADRPYRAAWSEEKTLEYIRGLSGTHLDPQVVQAFFDNQVYRLHSS